MVRKITSFFSNNDEGATNLNFGSTVTREVCLLCDTDLIKSRLYARDRICPECRFHYNLSAFERIKLIADPGSFRETSKSLISTDPLSFSSKTSYKKTLARDQKRTGLTEAVVTGSCRIGGARCMLVVLDFGFMGGSMGSVVGEKISLAFEEASKKKIPVISVITSGGARFQEGVLSLMQMSKTCIAANKLSDAGVPFISVLANPSTGQAYASFANMADIILAEPGTIMGYSPLRSIMANSEESISDDSHTAESHLSHGMIDAIVDRSKLREIISVLLDLFQQEFKITQTRSDSNYEIASIPKQAWHSVRLSRHDSRPSSMDFMARMLDNFVEIHGDRYFQDDPSIVCGLGQLGGQTIVLVGHERGRPNPSITQKNGRPSPEGFRKAQRALRLADKFKIPVITFIDTPGADLSIEAENRGLGNAIANTLSLMSNLKVPTISVLIGEGGSASALTLGISDKVLMLENAIYSAISPEEAAELIYQTSERVEEAAESLRLTSSDCKELEIVDVIVPEPEGGAHTDHHEASRLLKRSLLRELSTLQRQSERRRLRNRYNKFRNVGAYSSRVRSAISHKITAIQKMVSEIPDKSKLAD